MSDGAGRRSRVWSLVLAAGSATRFGSPKQFEEIAGRTLVARAVDTVAPASEGVVLVLPEDHPDPPPAGGAVVGGGATRSRSVRRGLTAVPDEAGIVVIHDAAHPLASRALADAVIAAVRGGAEAAVPGLPVAEALRRTDDGWMGPDVERSGLVLVQMPQAFAAGVLRDVHAGEPEAVEDSWLVRRAGGRVRVVPGDPRNLHVTTQADLALARAVVHGTP